MNYSSLKNKTLVTYSYYLFIFLTFVSAIVTSRQLSANLAIKYEYRAGKIGSGFLWFFIIICLLFQGYNIYVKNPEELLKMTSIYYIIITLLIMIPINSIILKKEDSIKDKENILIENNKIEDGDKVNFKSIKMSLAFSILTLLYSIYIVYLLRNYISATSSAEGSFGLWV